MLRWGVLGTGFISNTVIEAISGSEGSRVDVVAGRNPDRVEEIRRAHGIDRGVVGLDQVIEDPDIDAIYVGLPNHKHHDVVIAASAAGKAVLSEKSLTTTMESAEALATAVRANGTFFVEGLMYLAHPLYRRLLEILQDGRLGEVRSISGRYAADIWQVVNPAGMGTIYNLGCYPVSLLHLVVQATGGDGAFAARSLTGVGNQLDDSGNVCDAAMAVRFDNGVLATIQSTDSYGNGSEFAITGTNGVLRFETNPWLPVAGDNVMTWRPFGEDDGSAPIVVHSDHDAFHHQIKTVEACIAAGLTEAPRPSPRIEDSLEIMGMLTEWETACRS